MEILVCVKQVPDDSVEISLDPKTGAPALDGVTPVVNAFDTYALEMAVRLKEAAGGEVTVLAVLFFHKFIFHPDDNTLIDTAAVNDRLVDVMVRHQKNIPGL